MKVIDVMKYIERLTMKLRASDEHRRALQRAARFGRGGTLDRLNVMSMLALLTGRIE